MKTVTALTFRKKLGRVLDDVVRSGSPVAISRGNKPLVVMVPFEEYQHSTTLHGRQKRLCLAAQRLAEWRRAHAEKLKKIDPVQALRESREAGR